MAQKTSAAVVDPTADFLTPAQVAARMQVSRQVLYYWRAKGQGPMSVKLLGQVRYPRSEFEAWLARETARTMSGEKASA